LANVGDVQGPDPLGVRIPSYEVQDVTMEQALSELQRWRVVRFGLEKVPLEEGKEDVRFSVSLRDASVREILEALVKADKRYTWRRYEGYRPNVPTQTDLINVLPVGGDKDPDNLMNIRAKKAVVNYPGMPHNAISYISYFVPEIARKLYQGTIAGSMAGGPFGGNMSVELKIEFRDLTVREILNELALMTPGLGWVYEVSISGEPSSDQQKRIDHKWRALW